MSKTDPIQINVLSSHLFKTISTLINLVPTNPLVPILANFLFKIEKDMLTITAYDLYTAVVTRVPVKASGATKMAVPAGILVETLRNLPEQPLTMDLDHTNYSLTITTANGRYKIACESPVDFPTIPVIEEKQKTVIQVPILKKAIKQTLFVAGKDETHPNICGVHISADQEGMTFVATDGHRLVRYQAKIHSEGSATSVTLPSKSLQLLTQLLADSEEKLDIILGEKRGFFAIDHTRIIVSIIEEPYPDYQSVIPKHNPYQLTLQTNLLKNALRLMNCYANRTTHEVRLDLTKNLVEIHAEDFDFSNQGQIKLPCAYEGKPMQIGVNAKLFFELTKNMPGEEMVLHLDDPQKAILMTPKHQEKDSDLLMLAMPVLIKEND